MTTGMLVLGALLWGALAGALLPRAAYRFAVPSGEPWRDRCPGGHHPVRGWLGGVRCGQCARGGQRGGAEGRVPVTPYQPYAPSAPLLATALVCAALTAATGTRPELAVWLLLAPVGVLLAAVDFRVQRLPDPLTLPLAATALALLGLAALLPEHAGHWRTALYGALALGAGYYVLYRVNPGGMGFGDVKLAVGAGAVLGWYGWPTVLLGTFAGFLLGALYGGALVLARRAGRKTAVPFGPFLLAGALTGLLIGAYAA
ncbi:type IV peptidase [Streptomyces hygroscopicus subsp. jinggangensis 5008]|nr:type IV peptidase [Streptomyces hygroscopicus subsp. jinggangensis 5008]AGF65115.1 type IV peptidase [Streptomyces hygroscopicus subsp. jinggangensis TL01]